MQPGRDESITYTKQIPLRAAVDVAVFGAGIAGVCAAIAAADLGQRVLLVERFGIAGGNSTTGGVASFCGNTVGQGVVFDEILAGLDAFRALAPLNPCKSSRVFHHEVLAVVLQELLLKHGVQVLLHSRLIDAICKDGEITSCVIAGKSGVEAVRAKQVIDCTGDGDVARFAGFQTIHGDANGNSLPMSLMYFVRHCEERANEVPEGWFEKIHCKDDLPMTSIWPNGEGGNAIKIKVPMFDATDSDSLTKAEIAARRKMMAVLDYHQRCEKKPWRFDHCSPQIGIREGCRILGDYLLTVDDLRNGAEFEDKIAVGTFYLDGHKPDDDKRSYILPKDALAVPPYTIPLRCLIARDGRNLMMAGRCLSADQLALSSARVTTTCAMTGQAAGITAALAAKQNCSIRQLPFQAVQRVLLQGGALLERAQVSEVYVAKN